MAVVRRIDSKFILIFTDEFFNTILGERGHISFR